jgi:hypothetical protein
MDILQSTYLFERLVTTRQRELASESGSQWTLVGGTRCPLQMEERISKVRRDAWLNAHTPWAL